MWTNATGENLFDERYFPETQASEGGVPIQVVSAGPDSRWETIRQAYLGTIALARDHVYLQSPFLILDTSVAEAMTTAALAGVDVRVMIAPGDGELSPAYRAGMTYAADMARRGSGLAVPGRHFTRRPFASTHGSVRSDRQISTSAAFRSTTRRTSSFTTRR